MFYCMFYFTCDRSFMLIGCCERSCVISDPIVHCSRYHRRHRYQRLRRRHCITGLVSLEVK